MSTAWHLHIYDISEHASHIIVVDADTRCEVGTWAGSGYCQVARRVVR